MWRCHDCRTQNAAGAGFCQSCGQPRRAAPGLVSVFFLLDRSIDPVALFPQLKGALREVKSHLRGIDSKPRLLITLIPIRLRLVVAGGPGALQSLGEVTFVEAVADARSGLSEMQRRITALRERSGGVPTIEFLFLPRSAEVLSFADRYLPEYRKWMGAEAPPGAGDSTPSLFHLFCNADLDRLRTEGGKASWTSRFTGFLSDLLSGFMPKSALPPAPMAMPSPPAGEPPACFAPAPPPAAPPPPTASSGRRSIPTPASADLCLARRHFRSKIECAALLRPLGARRQRSTMRPPTRWPFGNDPTNRSGAIPGGARPPRLHASPSHFLPSHRRP
jgi:hypothetical protein